MNDNVLSEVLLDDGKKIVVINRLGMQDLYGKVECARNIYYLNGDGEMIWRVFSNYDDEGNPFTNIRLICNEIEAYRWDGGRYSIDKECGFATPKQFLK
ncbi:hypothetical protein [Pantoea stewartii]|uniref:hypothetical protein n=1 Tax=Pantoea stewartii TaxID=66269 RepID=UPI001981F617|nr:hypothetical protein [Pantoea stewartii]